MCALGLVLVTGASAGWGGHDPAKNYPLRKLPLACTSAPMGKPCINAGVRYLDRARAKVGLPPYKLPANFPSLAPARQMFVLTNLDRIQYGLPPIRGLTAALNLAALVNGVQSAADPAPAGTAHLSGWTANWAGAYDNAPMAYEAWMWDDGLGSKNADCTASHPSGCWTHRHDVLWRFHRGAVLAMGAAAGYGPTGRAYAMLIVGGRHGYAPRYAYTWRQAVADGAGTNTYTP